MFRSFRMIVFPRLLALALGLGAAVATLATAQGLDPLAAAVKARQAHMTLNGANIGVLGAMAQDKMPYDAGMASAAASNLAAIAGLDQSQYWVVGSEAGAVEGSRALPAIWEQPEAFLQAQAGLLTAATALAGEAGNGLDALKTGFGPVGGACGDCHRTYRQTE